MNSLDIFFVLGIILILIVIVFGMICTLIFYLKGRKLKDTLREEYGDPAKYNLKIRE